MTFCTRAVMRKHPKLNTHMHIPLPMLSSNSVKMGPKNAIPHAHTHTHTSDPSSFQPAKTMQENHSHYLKNNSHSAGKWFSCHHHLPKNWGLSTDVGFSRLSISSSWSFDRPSEWCQENRWNFREAALLPRIAVQEGTRKMSLLEVFVW